MPKSDYLKAKEISEKTKLAVLERQKYKSVVSNLPLTLQTASFHHYVERGQSGIGYEWNIVALTFNEHRALHDGNKVFKFTSKQAEALIHNYLSRMYKHWSKDNCKYHKWYTEKDYGVTRNEEYWK